MQVKICGLTNLADARAAAVAGADLLGFIFAASSRQVNAGRVRKISDNLAAEVDTVGVFANQKLGTVQKISQTAGLDFIQLHGEEPPSYCRQLELPVIKAFRVQDKSYLKQLKKYQVKKYLLDTYVPDKLGGTGRTFNWELAQAAKQYGKVFIAGGLDETNVQRAVAAANPHGVDINSGIEVKPGNKDQDKLTQVINKVRSAKGN